jgi:uncharacterized repeat protein (TIGR02543 family)
MRRLATAVTAVAITFSGLAVSPSYAVSVPADGTYLCSTGLPSADTPNFTITSGVVTAGRACVGSVIIPEGVISIGRDPSIGGAFQSSSITSISLPSSLLTIDTAAFAGSQLASISLPSSLQTIGSQAFSNVRLLTSIEIPASVSSIAEYAFWNSEGLRALSFLRLASPSQRLLISPPTTSGYVFGGWYSDSAFTTPLLDPGASTPGTGDLTFDTPTAIGQPSTVYAKLNGITYNITYDSNGGSAIAPGATGAPGTFVFGGQISAPTADTNRAGYGLRGWSLTDGGSLLTFPYTPISASDLTLFAEWGSLHSVSYNTSGGSSLASGSFVFGEQISAPTDPNRAGYSFSGWSLTDGGSVISFPYTPTSASDLSLYATWSALPSPPSATATASVLVEISSVEVSPGSSPGSTLIRVDLRNASVIARDALIRGRLLDFDGVLIREIEIKLDPRTSEVEFEVRGSVGDFNVEASAVTGAGASPAIQSPPAIVSKSFFTLAGSTRVPVLEGRTLAEPIAFGPNSSRLSASAKTALRKIASSVQGTTSRIALTGFSARVDTNFAFQKRLSIDRAFRVARFLKKRGVENWVFFHGYGGLQPKGAYSEMRKVELRVLD